MIENEIKNDEESTEILSYGKINKIFENQRITLNKDVLFIKEDILKDFKRIENNLNSKYEKQNTQVSSKLYKFESIIEAMKNKIDDLSSLISTDKNIQQKILQLSEFKRSTADKIMDQQMAIKSNSSQLKEAINKYDKILTDSVIYPAVIGHNARFKDFHEMIDYILYSIKQFNSFNEKNGVDFEESIGKIDNLFKLFKGQTDSIVTSCNNFCSKRTTDIETKFEKMVFSQEIKINEYQKEGDSFNKKIMQQIGEFNDTIKNLNKAKDEIYKKFEEEIKILNEYKNEMNEKIEKVYNIFELSNQNIKEKDGKIDIIKQSNNNIFTHINQNEGINLKNSQIGTSLVKKYIAGELSYNELEDSQTKKKIFKTKGKDTITKRMTFGPSNNNNNNYNYGFINKRSAKNLYNKIRKEDEEITYSSNDNSIEKKRLKKANTRNIDMKNTIGLKIPSLLNDDLEKSNDIYSTKGKAYQLIMLRDSNENVNKNENLSNKNKNYYYINKRSIFENTNSKNVTFKKLKSIGDNKNMINYDKRKKKNNCTSVDFYSQINNINKGQKYNYYSIFNNYEDIKIKNTKKNKDIIEVNFNQKFENVKDKDDLQDLLVKIKENRRQFTSERNNNHTRKNRSAKLIKSDIGTNNQETFYKNEMVNEEIQNYKSYDK
jgi:hypothetical protein